MIWKSRVMIQKFRYNYWSCSKFANFIRGTPKPWALEWDEWEDWRKTAKEKHPWRFWLAEEGLNKLQNFFFFPYDVWSSWKYYYKIRFRDKLHYLKTGFKPGEYYDLDERILYALFNELKIFVEKKRNFEFEVDSEVLSLYNWWRDERPKRPDPFEECSKHEVSENLTKMLEEQYDEDTDKLVQLIKIRNKLWH